MGRQKNLNNRLIDITAMPPLWLLVLVVSSSDTVSPSSQIKSVTSLIERVVPEYANHFICELIHPPFDHPSQQTFEIEQTSHPLGINGTGILLRGTSGVALASAFNYYLKYVAYAQVNVWFSSQTSLSLLSGQALPTPAAKIVVQSPYTMSHYMNICTFGYSTLFWDWTRWEQEIDWMALNGVINPLAMVGQDAIWFSIFTEDFGVPAGALLDNFFTGPAFSPWHWMGNLNQWGGPVNTRWLQGQLALQKKILTRMVSLGMKPILPAFAGHVPSALQKSYPAAKITQLPSWHGHMPPGQGSYFLDPSEGLFKQIGNMFVRRQLALYNETGYAHTSPHYYLADPYNEMPPPAGSTTRWAIVFRHPPATRPSPPTPSMPHSQLAFCMLHRVKTRST
jgi:alpha-N-acetylglucosaminidase